MHKLGTISLASCLLSLSGCSNGPEVASAPPAYVGIPAGLMERCVVRDVELNTTGDLVTSRNIYKKGFEVCAARVEAIRKHDAEARAAASR